MSDRVEARTSRSSGAIGLQNAKRRQRWTKMKYRFSWRALADSTPKRRVPPVPVRLHREVAIVLTPSIEVGRP